MREEVINDPKDKRPIGLLSIDTKRLVDRLAEVKPGETISYQEMTSVVGRNVQREARSTLESARYIVLRDHRALFDVVRDEGLRRLRDSEVPQVGAFGAQKIRREARRWRKRITFGVKDFGALPDEAKRTYGVYTSYLGLVEHMSKEKQVKRIEAAFEQDGKGESLPIQRTLEAFRNGGK